MKGMASILATLLAACGGGGGGQDDTTTDQPQDTVDTQGDTATDSSPDTAADDAAVEVECATDGDCDDSNPCTVDGCDLDYNTCSHDPVDADGDGYPAMEVEGTGCTGGTDCDDGAGNVYPGAAPDCTGGGDFDCDDVPDADGDADGWVIEACAGGGEFDCDDRDDTIHPGVAERCDGNDEDCSGAADDADDLVLCGPYPEHTTLGCDHVLETCAVASCESGWYDYETGPENDCECHHDCTLIECDPAPVCGVECGACALTNGIASVHCEVSHCVIDTCIDGRANPDSSYASGCEYTCNCAGRECGPEPVCGTSCGTCTPPAACDESGMCI